MVIIKKTELTLLLINLIILNSCTLFVDRIKVEVPKDYVGWCYVIPVSDTTVNTSIFG